MANKNPLKIIKRPVAYASGYENIPTKAQDRAKQLCWEYNRTAPNEKNRRRAILQELLGTSAPITLKENIWVGANATICGGVTVGSGEHTDFVFVSMN